MQFRVLGPLEVVGDNGSTITIGSPNQRIVLSLLVAEPGRTVSTDRLIDALWGDEPPATATRTLRTYVSRLRQTVGDRLVTTAAGYRLDVAPDDVDAGRFAAAAREAGGPAELEAALAMWRGPAFGDLAGVDAIDVERHRLEELRNRTRERLATAQLESGRPEEAVATVEALVADDPFREGAWAVGVRALAEAARPADALRLHQRAVAVLAEAGLEPSAVLSEAERIALDGTATGAETTVRRSVPPMAVQSLVGREGDVDQIEGLLHRAPVVTLVGPGGVGKTRLAVDVARRTANRFRLGTRMVELAAVGEDGAVASAIADGLGLTSDTSDPSRLLERAGTLDVLVVLDNCEHVIDAAAAAVEQMTGQGGPLRVLATSRERLGAAGEHSWTVGPLPVTGAANPAAALFRERARAAAPDVDLGPETDPLVDRIVARLDGLPLAIEMAAARLATMGLGELADTLDDRLDLLHAPRRWGEERHQTLAHVIAWSEALLRPELRDLLAAASVFAGPVPAGDIEGVLGGAEAVDGIRTLAERSLVTIDRDADRVRYGMLHTVRSFARDRRRASARADELERTHAEWFVDAAREADALIRSPRERAGHDRFEEAFAELRAVHRRTRDTDPSCAAALIDALLTYSYSRMRSEPTLWAHQVLDAIGPGPAAAGALVTVANGLTTAGELAEARAVAEQAREAAGTTAVAPFVCLTLSDVSVYGGELDRAIAEAHQLGATARAVDDAYHVVFAVCQEALCLAYAGRRDEALAGLDAVGVPEAELAPTLVGWMAYSRGEAVADDDPQTALAFLRRATELADSVGNVMLSGVGRVSTAALLSRAGDPDEAVRTFGPMVEYWLELGDRTHQLTTLRNLVGLFLRIDAPAAGAELLGALLTGATVPTYGEEAERIARWEAELRGSLGDGHTDGLLAAGRTRSLEAAARTAIDALADLST